jgi:hypothetical protein
MKKNYFKLFSILIVAAGISGIISSCKKTENTTPVVSGKKIILQGDITKDTVIKATDTVFISGFVYVKNCKITIEAGTLIKGISGTKGTLIIERGAQIDAEGTAQKPIVFTSDKAPGQRSYGDWGGVVLCGNAPTNKHDQSAGVGIAEGGIGSLYGGTNPHDNSGIMKYVRIEFPGIPLATTANSEINGLTLYAVGDATTIDYIQVSYSGDDSYEWFGGTVNCKHLVALRGWDDDFDTDNGFSGNVQFIVGLRDPQAADQSGSNGFESDNDADGSTLTPNTSPVFCNASVFGPLNGTTTMTTINSLFKRAMHLRRGSTLSVFNSVFAGYPIGLMLDGEKGNTPTQADNNVLQIENCIMAGMDSNYGVSTSNPVATPYTTAQVEAYYTSAARKNSLYTTVAELKLNDAFNLTNPNFLPKSDSPLLTGALFTNSKLSNSFFTPVTYKGAFGTENWTSGWCNFDPQNTVY